MTHPSYHIAPEGQPHAREQATAHPRPWVDPVQLALATSQGMPGEWRGSGLLHRSARYYQHVPGQLEMPDPPFMHPSSRGEDKAINRSAQDTVWILIGRNGLDYGLQRLSAKPRIS
ncbi:hypothetical protein DL770_000406 [Monosporascus sp. CRB-9-2]|nr:hypothetical protein DL770_000406 [Monosporascus sp. CRB-9-2]